MEILVGVVIIVVIVVIVVIVAANQGSKKQAKEQENLVAAALAEGAQAARNGQSESSCPHFHDRQDPGNKPIGVLAITEQESPHGKRFWWLAGYRNEIRMRKQEGDPSISSSTSSPPSTKLTGTKPVYRLDEDNQPNLSGNIASKVYISDTRRKMLLRLTMHKKKRLKWEYLLLLPNMPLR